jgi:hypothetical protein
MDVAESETFGEAESDAFGETEDAIIEGEGHTAAAPAAFGIGLTDGGCTMTFIAPNIALTTRDCEAISKQVDVGGSTGKFRTVHEVIDAQRNPSSLLAVSMKKPVALAGNPFVRRADQTPVADGEIITCYGYTNGKLRSGGFEVGDSAGVFLSLAGRVTTTGYAKVGFEDIGGYCVRDGATDPVAILVSPTNSSGYASAVRLLDLDRGVRGAASLAEAVPNGAIRLADDTFSIAITAGLSTDEVTFDPLGSTDARQQAFYRQPIGSTGTAVHLVDVATGECLTRDGGDVKMKSCGNSGQTFEEHYQIPNNTGFYGYEEHGSQEAIDSSTSPMQTTPWSSAPEQQFLMGLTFF